MSCNCDEFSSKLSAILSLVKALLDLNKRQEERIKALETRVSDIEALLKEPINVNVDITDAIKKAAGL